MIHLLWDDLQHANGDVSMQERQPFQEKPPGVIHPLLIAPPMLQSEPHEVLQHIESFAGGDVPMSTFFDLGGEPRFDQGTSCEHGRGAQIVLVVIAVVAVVVADMLQNLLFIVSIGEDIPVAYHGDLSEVGRLATSDLGDVVPIGQSRVALQAAAAMNLTR